MSTVGTPPGARPAAPPVPAPKDPELRRLSRRGRWSKPGERPSEAERPGRAAAEPTVAG